MNKKKGFALAAGLLTLVAAGAGIYIWKKKKYVEQPVGFDDREEPQTEEEETLAEYEEKLGEYAEKVEDEIKPDLQAVREKARAALNKPPLVVMPPEEPVERKPEGIEVISPDDINYEEEGWEVITLSWFTDGVMLDDEQQRMPEYFEAVGTDFMHHFVDGTAAVKNWDRQIYYEILDEGCAFGDDDLEES